MLEPLGFPAHLVPALGVNDDQKQTQCLSSQAMTKCTHASDPSLVLTKAKGTVWVLAACRLKQTGAHLPAYHPGQVPDFILTSRSSCVTLSKSLYLSGLPLSHSSIHLADTVNHVTYLAGASKPSMEVGKWVPFSRHRN